MFENFTFLPYLLSGFIGIGLAASAGFRVFLPLFIVSLGSYLGVIPENENWTWLSSLPVLIATGIATVAEIIAYYIPLIDNLLDSIALPAATLAGTFLFASQFTEMGSFAQWALALIAGGGTASIVSSGFATSRVASTATTGGFGNFLVSTIETVGAGILPILSFLAPVFAGIIAIGLVIIVFIFGKKVYNHFWKKEKLIL